MPVLYREPTTVRKGVAEPAAACFYVTGAAYDTRPAYVTRPA
ncbi:hypothetical protein QNO07_05020 [Streptomyces sp. 549]|nr:hypothetical protein [Streptomyces sp. 549]MDK1472796.1 hypothetical protein [Streptomyces sp. 549]